jgi:hypothetical protein
MDLLNGQPLIIIILLVKAFIMKEKLQQQSFQALGKAIAKKEQKKIKGGAQCDGFYCANTTMPCLPLVVPYKYCITNYPASGGVYFSCRYDC